MRWECLVVKKDNLNELRTTTTNVTFTPCGEPVVKTLLAGQHHEAGYANFSAASNGMVIISIEFNPGYSLQDDSESVKINWSNSAFVGNQAPGLFPRKGTNLVETVPVANFYAIHLDVNRPC